MISASASSFVSFCSAPSILLAIPSLSFFHVQLTAKNKSINYTDLMRVHCKITPWRDGLWISEALAESKSNDASKRSFREFNRCFSWLTLCTSLPSSQVRFRTDSLRAVQKFHYRWSHFGILYCTLHFGSVGSEEVAVEVSLLLQEENSVRPRSSLALVLDNTLGVGNHLADQRWNLRFYLG